MKKRTISRIIIPMAAFLVIVSCGSKQEQQAPQAPPAPFPVAQLQPKTVTSYAEYPTTIEGIVNSDVRAKTSGYIQKVLVDEGQKVRKGQVLFRLETQSLSQDASAAKARINVAQVEVNKLIPLVEKNIISEVQLETAKANLAQAKANYSSVSANIGYATIKSPVDGYVGAINFREGALISPSDPTPLTTVSDISKVYAFFSLNETQYLDFLEKAEGKTLNEKLANYPEVSLILANGSTYSEKGKIQTSTGQINPSTGTVSLRAIFNNPNRLITNGNSGKIQIPNTFENAIVVPQQATYEQQGNVMIFKVGEDNKVSTSIIKIKSTVDNLYVVESGLDPKDKIVTTGVGKLKNGVVITPQETSFDDAIKPIATLFKN
ncbi:MULTISPECIES: efflux RND transporter periplasmic adaptor subunit [Cellulophaga]|uniref:Efflux transporter, RND family, MFP subunit n=2 Tax=Cellulophaga TaxID=104264 RepID=F0RGW4_CELLC|nr:MULTISPECIES: efflux RND transporter periplasmic adaptor subunit [Cellulophaga]ADY30168.1 efflux transporter, RND family, MFP subunit [Cellulophaga lytica DSM 7489]AIM61162.1 secretion protein HlyD [Cellulophaga lytica]APU11027.1 efflux transporter periplasmic adaptor subunit [Cellulophaga lytica]EWH13785.1 RND family efflux transporter MFP subunit [Cellulophaga geojensis KL-A]TVZ10501.1 membrane fusion protein (multidrug efflux system) [Cellulophaga sp. RHA_52]